MAEQVTEARAIAKIVRVAPRKARLVLDTIRNKDIAEAFAILEFLPNTATEAVSKVLKSAVANAENNLALDRSELVIIKTFANEGPTMKRFRPRAKGSASNINKRTSHITVVVGLKDSKKGNK